MQHLDEQYILDNFEKALENGYIRAYFQPVIRTLTGKMCSAEALARWDDPVAGLLSPYLFISVLEEHRLIHKLDLVILDSICDTYSKLKNQGLRVHPFSINLSRIDFDEIDMFEAVMEILNKYDVPPHAIHIEITESVMLDNTSYFKRVFDKFHEAGFEIWMDDFGSGYSSLNVLKDYVFDILKIDMKFLSDVGFRSKKIISSIINMAKLLGVHTLAEGIENEEQMLFLKDIGCEMLQGFYYSKPMSAEEHIDYVADTDTPVEDLSEQGYWNTVGKINFLSANPLNEYMPMMADSDNEMNESNFPLALFEFHNDIMHTAYMNDAFFNQLKKLGISSIAELEEWMNDVQSPYPKRLREQVSKSLVTDGVVKFDYVMNNIYYTFKTKEIAKTSSRFMIAANLQTFDPEREQDRSDELMKYSQSLFATYEHVTLLEPDHDRAKQLYSNAGFEKNYGVGSIRDGLKDFAANEVHPDDRERYLSLFDFDTLSERIKKSGDNFIQQPFRIRMPDGNYRWKRIRISRIPSPTDNKYLYTIQLMSRIGIDIAETSLLEHPELYTVK
jgi:EAL domain-containing protein (putative c-di-GMP-specific phosphodiesterase class I)